MLVERKEEGIDVHEIYEKYLEELREVSDNSKDIVPCFTERELAKLLYGKKAVSIIPDDTDQKIASKHMQGLEIERTKQRRAEKKAYAIEERGQAKEDTVLAFKVEPTKTTMTIILDDRSVQLEKELVETEEGLKPVYNRVDARKLGDNASSAFCNIAFKSKDREKGTWEYTFNRVDRNFSNILYDWYEITESWIMHNKNLFANRIEEPHTWTKKEPSIEEDKFNMNNLESKINLYFVNSITYNAVSSEPFYYNEIYPFYKEPYDEIDKKYDEIERVQEEEALKQAEANETIGDININDYIRWKKESADKPLSNDQLETLANKLKFLEAHNMPITEEQQRLIRRAEENRKMQAFEEKIERFKEQKKQRERALAEKEKQIKAHNEEIEERINNPESYVRDREDYFKDMNELLEGLTAIHEIDSSFLSEDQKTTLDENKEFFRMREESSKETHIRDEGMSEMVREWYKDEYSDNPFKGKHK